MSGATRSDPAGAPDANRPRRDGQEIATEAFLFLIPDVLFLEINLVGRLLFSEVLMIAAFPFLVLFRGQKLVERGPAMVLLLGVIWLMSQIATDIIRDTPFGDYSRGWSKIIFLMINFAVLYILIDNRPRRMSILALGFALGTFLMVQFNPTDYMVEKPWKFGLGFASVMAITVFIEPAYRRGHMAIPVLALFAMSMFLLFEGARALGAITLATVAYISVQMFLARNRVRRVSFSPGRAAVILAGGALVAMLMQEVYSYAAMSGALGETAREKYFDQARGEYGILLGGRMEIYASSHAIMDSPIIGHGSWAKDRKYVAMLLDLRRKGYEVSDTVFFSDLIPSHSHFFGAWVEAGVLGAVFWGWNVVLCLSVLTSMFLIRHPIVPLIAFIGIAYVWDVLFSPFGMERRLIVAFSIVFLLFARDHLLKGRVTE